MRARLQGVPIGMIRRGVGIWALRGDFMRLRSIPLRSQTSVAALRGDSHKAIRNKVIDSLIHPLVTSKCPDFVLGGVRKAFDMLADLRFTEPRWLRAVCESFFPPARVAGEPAWAYQAANV